MDAPTRGTVRNAWIALVATGVTFVLGIAVGEGIFAAFGYETGVTDAPLVPTLVSAVVAIAVIDSAPLAAWWLGRKAVRAGDAGGRLPMLLGIGVAALVLLLNLAGALAR